LLPAVKFLDVGGEIVFGDFDDAHFAFGVVGSELERLFPPALRLFWVGRCGKVAAMKWELLQRITIEPGKCGGRPCIRGKRIRVTDILELLSAGASQEEILRDYPFLEREDILAAIEYAAQQADHAVLHSS
jgi:uncharacterized protein (DUF433 family)